MAKSGDQVTVTTSDQTLKGMLMPNQETDAVIIKLPSGYNIGINKKKVKNIEVTEGAKKTASKRQNVIFKKGLPLISILHTGGTIASKVNYETGGVISKFSPAELVDMFPELKKITNINSELIEQMFSEDMRFIHYQKMAKAIEKELEKNVDGIIITHGTDTLGYTAAALSFICENLPIPIILVGAQRSSDRGSSDAALNLICAAEFITKTDFAGVAICMHLNANDNTAVILPGTKTRKLHTSARDAFKPVNDTAIATIDYDAKKITYIKKDYPKKSEGKTRIRDKFSNTVAIVRCHPNMVKEQFDFYQNYAGLIIEGTGLGHAPVDPPHILNEKMLESIHALVKGGTIVAMTSQCIYGRVHPHIYTAALHLDKAGVIYCKDMLTETAFIKLAWLLGNYKKEEVKALMEKNLRGEINERLQR